MVSRLIKWSVAGEFKRENQLLGGFILVVLALFFFGSGVIVTLTGFTFIQTISRLVLSVALGAAALFFTYDTIHYFQYVDELQTKGYAMDVVAVDTDRTSHGRKHSWYTYNATFRFKGQDRVIAVEEADYDRIKSGNTRLVVGYNPALDDFIAADYSPDYGQWVVPAVLLFLLVSVARSGRATPQPNPVP